MKTSAKNYTFYWEKSNPNVKGEPVIKIDVPGYLRNEISANLTSNAINISASKKSGRMERGNNFFRKESSSSAFSRVIVLPFKVNARNFRVEVGNGYVSIARKKAAKNE